MLPSYNEKIIFLFTELNEFLKNIHKDPELSIHGLRKRTKFIRALLRFDPIGYVNLNTVLRDMSRVIAPYRDASVNLGTFNSLRLDSPELVNSQIEAKLQSNSYILNPIPSPNELARIEELVFRFREEFDRSIAEPSSQMVYLRIYKSFKSGKKALKRVQSDTDIELVHTWRKRTKRLWYQLRFLFGDELENQGHPLNSSHNLGTLLGEIHDLDVFCLGLSHEDDATLMEHIAKKRLGLLKESLLEGEKLYSQWDPDLFQSDNSE